MANTKHLEIIKQGVQIWDEWRQVTFRGHPDLRGASLSHTNLSGANLCEVNLSDADLVEVDLSRADLSHANLSGAVLSGAKLISTDFREANLSGADLRRANLIEAIFIGADLSRANLSGVDLSEVDLTDADLVEVDLSGADLSEANLSGANLSGADLSEAILRKADLNGGNLKGTLLGGALLSDANLSHADLSGADLFSTNLFGADLSNVALSGANLTVADFTGANLRNADFRQADISGAHLIDADLSEASFHHAVIGHTTFGNNDLSTVKGLDTVIHRGPSTIGVDTLYKSDGKIPEAFLREVGVPEDFITFLPSLVGRAIEFYSCFISYSHEDEDFSRRLHSRMRSQNLRVWYAPEDMKGGKKLHEEIFQAIQIHDKLLLVLSENSLNSEWVTTEIRRARKVERDENRRKLFPIRLVDFKVIQNWECFDADSGKDLAVELREYYIPDFSKWKDHDAFEREFSKLLRDLKATGF